MEKLIALILKIVIMIMAGAAVFGLVNNMWVYIIHGGLNGSLISAIISFSGMILAIVLIFVVVWKFVWSES